MKCHPTMNQETLQEITTTCEEIEFQNHPKLSNNFSFFIHVSSSKYIRSFFRSWSKINMELCKETIPWATWITVRSFQCWGIISRTLQISIYNSRQLDVSGAHCGVTSSETVQNYSRMNFLVKNGYAWKLPQDSRLDTQKVRNWVKVSIAYNTLNPHHRVVKDFAPITFLDRKKSVSPHQYQKRLMISETIHIKIFFRPGKWSTAIHYGWRCSHHQAACTRTQTSHFRGTWCVLPRGVPSSDHTQHMKEDMPYIWCIIPIELTKRRSKIRRPDLGFNEASDRWGCCMKAWHCTFLQYWAATKQNPLGFVEPLSSRKRPLRVWKPTIEHWCFTIPDG